MAIAKAKKKLSLSPQAVIAGLATAGVFLWLWRKSSTDCELFHDIYQTPGPIYLTEEAQEEAFSFARLRLRSVTASNDLITKMRLQRDIAEEMSPYCDWSDIPKDTSIKRRVWDSFGHISEYVYKEFYTDRQSDTGHQHAEVES